MKQSEARYYLPNPCPKAWDGMTPSGIGRHCHACDHLVVDFEGWKPEDIRDYLKSNLKTCGRIEERQLQAIGGGRKRLRIAAVVVSILGFSFSSSAQSDTLKYEQTKPATLTVPRPGAEVKKKDKPKKKRRRQRRRSKRYVQGRFLHIGYLENKLD